MNPPSFFGRAFWNPPSYRDNSEAGLARSGSHCRILVPFGRRANFFPCSRESAFALLVAPFFTSAVAPGAKPSRPRHHALGGTSLAPSPVHSFELANLQDDPKRPPLPVCFIVSADEAVPSQGPQGRRPRAGARPRSQRFGHVHQPGWRMHAVLVEGQRRATLPFAAPRC